MNLQAKTTRPQVGGQKAVSKSSRRNSARRWSEVFGLRRPMHDRMLVLNIGIFNVENGWSRIFNPVKAHENGI
jgi:hypothetical protein